jgi:hypothetical protein
MILFVTFVIGSLYVWNMTQFYPFFHHYKFSNFRILQSWSCF